MRFSWHLWDLNPRHHPLWPDTLQTKPSHHITDNNSITIFKLLQYTTLTSVSFHPLYMYASVCVCVCTRAHKHIHTHPVFKPPVQTSKCSIAHKGPWSNHPKFWNTTAYLDSAAVSNIYRRDLLYWTPFCLFAVYFEQLHNSWTAIPNKYLRLPTST